MPARVPTLLSTLVRALPAFLIAICLAVSPVRSDSAEPPIALSKVQRAILMEADTGAVRYQLNADQLASPASMSKLMTLAVLFKVMKDGKVKPTDEFVMSVNAWRNGGAPSGTAAMFVPVNTKATVADLIQGIAVQSGNDAAMAIAEGIAGSEDAFARIMIKEARRIGLTRSTFGNATGLPNPNQLMTARDLAKLAQYIINEYPDQYRVFSQKEFQYRRHKFYNRNPLLKLDIGVDGLKTGHTKEAGYGIVASAVQNGKRLIAVVMGCPTAADRLNQTKKLLEWGFSAFTDVSLFDADEVVGYARVWGGESMYVPLAAKEPVTLSVPKRSAKARVGGEIVYKAPLKPPVNKGDNVALLRVRSATAAQREIPLFATETVKKGGIVRQGLDTLVLMALRRLAF